MNWATRVALRERRRRKNGYSMVSKKLAHRAVPLASVLAKLPRALMEICYRRNVALNTATYASKTAVVGSFDKTIVLKPLFYWRRWKLTHALVPGS